MNNLIKLIRTHRKKLMVVWCCVLIIMAFYVFNLIKSEREHEWQNIHQYIFKNGWYKVSNDNNNSVKKPNILCVELRNLDATHGEVLVKGSISVSFYDPDEYFGKKQEKEKREILKVEIESPKERYGYSPIVAYIDLSRGSDESGTFCAGSTETVFVPKEGHIFDYPLDNLIFLIQFNFEPKIQFNQIDFYNRIHGIILKDHPTITINGSKIVLDLETERKDSIKIAFWIIFISILLYIMLIIFFVKKLGSLVAAVGGFFISVWSIRSLFGEAALVYPSLLDLTVIFSSIVLLIGILTRIIFGYYNKDDG